MRLCAALLLLSACHSSTPVPPPPIDTFAQLLAREEGVTCDQITAHAAGEPPNCRKVYDAWVRARHRVAAVYPDARTVQMSRVFFFRPALHWIDPKPYPLINLMPDGVPPVYVRGVTSTDYPILLQYAYPQVVEHEAVHALLLILLGHQARREQDIEASTPDQRDPFLFQVGCHGTPDDPFGEPGNIAGCSEPYDGQ